MLSVVVWKWKANSEYRQVYTADHVNRFRGMLSRNLTLPHRLVCVSDDFEGLNPDIIQVPIWDFPKVEIKGNKPNCYRRLRMYSKEAREILGERILSIDLDCVIVANIDSLVDRSEDFVAWNKGGVPYQGGMILHTPGTRTFLWDEFDPVESRALGKAKGYCGSDQAWVSARLPAGEAVWTAKDGVLSYKASIRSNVHHAKTGELPPGTKIVFFHGNPKPWELRDRFVREHWRV